LFQSIAFPIIVCFFLQRYGLSSAGSAIIVNYSRISLPVYISHGILTPAIYSALSYRLEIA
jgi:hypothetical protein